MYMPPRVASGSFAQSAFCSTNYTPSFFYLIFGLNTLRAKEIGKEMNNDGPGWTAPAWTSAMNKRVLEMVRVARLVEQRLDWVGTRLMRACYGLTK